MRDNSGWAALTAQRATGHIHTAACKTRVVCWCVVLDEVRLTAAGGFRAFVKSETVPYPLTLTTMGVITDSTVRCNFNNFQEN